MTAWIKFGSDKPKRYTLYTHEPCNCQPLDVYYLLNSDIASMIKTRLYISASLVSIDICYCFPAKRKRRWMWNAVFNTFKAAKRLSLVIVAVASSSREGLFCFIFWVHLLVLWSPPLGLLIFVESRIIVLFSCFRYSNWRQEVLRHWQRSTTERYPSWWRRRVHSTHGWCRWRWIESQWWRTRRKRWTHSRQKGLSLLD